LIQIKGERFPKIQYIERGFCVNIQEKYEKLKMILREMGEIAVAYSGGVDSNFLAKVAKDVLEERAIAITMIAPLHSESEMEEANELAKQIGIRRIIIRENVLEQDVFKENPEDRCYHCKKLIFSMIKKVAESQNIAYVADGSNMDDMGDYRPGLKAIKELGGRSPLKEANLTKQEIRELSKQLNLPTWDKPAFACLATRFPYGETITNEGLRAVEMAENYLYKEGFKQYRVRCHGNLARIEVLPEDRKRFFDQKYMDEVALKFKSFGFTYVSLDLQGYRMGSMNESIETSGGN
jgi:uncharacterized protein